MEEKILKILHREANIPRQELADRLNISIDEVEKIIKKLEDSGAILGYTTIINQDHLVRKNRVHALIELKITPTREGGYDKFATSISRFPQVSSVYLMSGSYDLCLEVTGNSLQEVASFVARKLSTIDGVVSCATHFILKKYKDFGFSYKEDEEYERLSITP